jgi:hypothetical protein
MLQNFRSKKSFMEGVRFHCHNYLRLCGSFGCLFFSGNILTVPSDSSADIYCLIYLPKVTGIQRLFPKVIRYKELRKDCCETSSNIYIVACGEQIIRSL